MAIKLLAQKYIQKGIPTEDITVLSPYSAQVAYLKQVFRRTEGLTEGLDEELSIVEITTIDAYQGREAPIIILTLVNTDVMGFMANPHRLLSGLSRARDSLVVLTAWTSLSVREKFARSLTKLNAFRQAFAAKGAYKDRSDIISTPYHLSCEDVGIRVHGEGSGIYEEGVKVEATGLGVGTNEEGPWYGDETGSNSYSEPEQSVLGW